MSVRPPPPAPGSPPGSPPAPTSSALLDVYIVGGERLDAPALLSVASLIASRYQVAVRSVAEGLSGGWCLVGKRLPESAAARLSEELGDLGARTESLPAGGPLPTSRPVPSPRDPRRGPAPPAQGHARRPPPRAPTTPGLSRLLEPVLSHPLKRAFAALALALIVGFLPAAYYTFGISGAEVRRIRARQLELSAQPGTKAVVDEFDRLEAAIAQVRGRGLVHTGILWVLVTGIAGAGLSRIAGRGGRALWSD